MDQVNDKSVLNKMNPDEFVERAYKHYIESGDFNGSPLGDLMNMAGLNTEEVRSWLRELIAADKVVLRFGEYGNPFIKAMPDPPRDTQLKVLQSSNLSCVVVYPSDSVLADRVDRSVYAGRPFSLRLALGEAQLDYHSFDLSILEFYRNDPRYYYKVDDVYGSIHLKDDHARSGGIAEKDDVYLKTFGFSYDEQMNRSVATYTRYLHDLSPEHQQIWEAKRLPKRVRIHPDYYRASIQGRFSDHIPILTAFTFELHHINEMARLMGRPPLFRNTLKGERRPPHFTFLIRPTAKEFYDFVLLLDQAMSDNIDKRFFGNDVPLEEEIVRPDRRIEVRQKGSIAVLADWLNQELNLIDPEPIRQMIETFKKVRKLRQKPAHMVIDNLFDQGLFKQQRELIIEAYRAVRLIRLIFANHPKCRSYKVEDVLYDSRIRDF